VTLVDGKPQIDVKIVLEADVLAIQSTIDYEQGELTDFLEKYVEELIREEMIRFCKKHRRSLVRTYAVLGDTQKVLSNMGRMGKVWLEIKI
jgi:spore germination protein KC